MSDKTELQQKLAQLNLEEQDISIRMRAQTDFREKKRIEMEKGALAVEKTRLKEKLDAEIDRLSLSEIDQMLKDQILMIHVEVNGAKIQAHEYIEIKYNCAHKEKILLREVIRHNAVMGSTRTPERNYFLLQRWLRILNDGDSYTVHFNCQECRDERNSLKAKFGRRNDKPVGHATVTVRMLQ
jgi:hypothetical protein